MRIMHNVSMPAINHFTAGNGRMSLPVDPSLLVYSNFENVYGTAAPKNIRGVSINQLKLIDVLIRQFSALKDNPPGLPSSAEKAAEKAAAVAEAVAKAFAEAADAAAPAEASGSAQISALADAYRTQALQAQAASAAMPYIPAPNVPSGAVVSLVA
ncbi:MAG: hypothetical protein FWD91_02495 [Treponema sp.]|nr:hypothetical protein [Treponema sp.]